MMVMAIVDEQGSPETLSPSDEEEKTKQIPRTDDQMRRRDRWYRKPNQGLVYGASGM
jgi:hypothetical protein